MWQFGSLVILCVGTMFTNSLETCRIDSKVRQTWSEGIVPFATTNVNISFATLILLFLGHGYRKWNASYEELIIWSMAFQSIIQVVWLQSYEGPRALKHVLYLVCQWASTGLSIEVKRLLISSISSLFSVLIYRLLGEESWLAFSSVRAMFAWLPLGIYYFWV